MRLARIGRWQFKIEFENPFAFGDFEVLSINWEIGWGYFLTICNIVFMINIVESERWE